MIAFVTLLARKLILLNWKGKKPNTHSAMMRDVMQYLQLGKKYVFTERLG